MYMYMYVLEQMVPFE